MKGQITRRRNLRYTPEGFVPAPQPLFPAAAIGHYLQGERMLREEVAEWITISRTLERQLVLDMKIADRRAGLSAAERRSIAAAVTPEVNAMIAQARLEGYSVMPYAARLVALDTAGIPVRLGLPVLLPDVPSASFSSRPASGEAAPWYRCISPGSRLSCASAGTP